MDRFLQFKLKAVEETGQIRGFVSVYGNKDLNGDIIEPGAFAKTLQENGGEVPLLAHHDRTKPVGIATLTDEAKGLMLDGRIEIDLPDGQLVHKQALKGLLRGLSIGYRTIKEMWDDSVKAYRLHEVKLFEASMVTIPANPATYITSVKSDAVNSVMELALQEIKAGRKISAATRKRLEAAIEEIQALLAEPEAAEGDKAAADEPLVHSLRGLTAILRTR
jgi:HK97 family phage prohead protease